MKTLLRIDASIRHDGSYSRTLGDFFPRPSLVQHIQQSFSATDTLGAFDVKAHVNGGGKVSRLVFSSSVAVFGPDPAVPLPKLVA